MKKIAILFLMVFDVSASCDYLQHVKHYSDHYSFNADFILSVIRAESNFDCNAVSKKGAKGLMQLMDETAKKYNVSDSFNAADNINGGTALLSDLLKKYDDIDLVLAAYNAGEGAVNKYNAVPPYKETQNYISKIKGFFKIRTGIELTMKTAMKKQDDPNSPWVRFRVSSPWQKHAL